MDIRFELFLGEQVQNGCGSWGAKFFFACCKSVIAKKKTEGLFVRKQIKKLYNLRGAGIFATGDYIIFLNASLSLPALAPDN